MSLFKRELPPIEKYVEPHPWARTVKDVYSNKIKYVHNSIKNPKYPEQKKIPKNENRIKFTIIGDRITKEFAYCVNLVKGLHKYRKKNFDAPVIQGVNTVEWSSVWNNLKLRFGGISFCISSKVAVLINETFLGGEEELKTLIGTKYVYHLCLDYYKESIGEFAKFIKYSRRSCAYMHIAIDDVHIGTFIFMLYTNILPHTCENFLRLCKETRGGYAGTPIHRIVKDGWIQGGGFGLKETNLNCENFMVPHDRRGVLCMANAGRHIECSTQFFILLQPAPWMAYKYVAFGQLIEGEATLKKIEDVPTWHQSPNSTIIIYKAGIFNMECHDIMINRGAKEYIQDHTEDLNAFKELIYEVLLEKVFLTIQMRELELLQEQDGEGAEEIEFGEAIVRETQRFNRIKEDIEKQLQSQNFSSQGDTASRRVTTALSAAVDNNDFDVEEYNLEGEAEEVYAHQSLPPTPSLVVKPEHPYYLPQTDVPYPGEVNSDFNLRRFLQGDYCLPSDIKNNAPKKTNRENYSYLSDVLDVGESEPDSGESLDSEEETEIKHYLQTHGEKVSFAGSTIRQMAYKGTNKINLFEGLRKSEWITDDELRKLRIASVDYRSRENRDKKVSISVPDANEDAHHTKIKRRQTGFVRPEDLEKIHVFQKSASSIQDEDDSTLDMSRKVRIATSTIAAPTGRSSGRRQTGFVRPSEIAESDTNVRQSVLTRLFDEVQGDDEPPLLKDYKPFSESHRKSTLLTFSPNSRIKSVESVREKFRQSLTVRNDSYDQVMKLQHGKTATTKISSDYVKTIDHVEHKAESSIRSLEFSKKRPMMTVSEYHMKNKQYQHGLKSASISNARIKSPKNTNSFESKGGGGLRLPGDSPLYSMIDMKD